MFSSIKPRRTAQQVPPDRASDDQSDQNAHTNSNFISTQEAVFACLEEGCTRTFLRHSSLQRHLDCGKHDRALERETLMDRAAVDYAERLEGQPSSLPETRVETNANTRREYTLSASEKLSLGWALKASSTRRSRFTASQKAYLTNKFKLGEQTGQKAAPASVARAMASAKDARGNRLFTSDGFLSANLVAGFFSRLSAKKTLHEVEELEAEDEAEDDFQSAVDEASIEKLTNVAVQELQIRHPICHDVYNLCDMAAR